MPVSSKEFLGFTLKRVRDIIRAYNQMHLVDKYSQFSSSIWPVWPNGWVFVYKLNGCEFKSRCSHLKESQVKKKKKLCNFYNFSLLFPCPDNFVVVCIFIIFFHGIYPPYPQIFFCGGLIFFLYLVARGWEYFRFLGDLLYWGVLISFLGGES